MEKTQTKSKINQWIITAVVAVVFAVGGFFGGTKYQQSKTPSFSSFGNRGANGQFTGTRGAGRGNGFTPVAGQIVSADNTSITVKLGDGSSKIILLSSSTTINKATTGAQSDLTTGTEVAVFGTANADGSVTAQNVQINPGEMGRGFGGRNSSPSPSPSY